MNKPFDWRRCRFLRARRQNGSRSGRVESASVKILYFCTHETRKSRRGRGCHTEWCVNPWKTERPMTNHPDQAPHTSHPSFVQARLSRMRELHQAGHISDEDMKFAEESGEEK
ncbi:MAG: hypothetical protein QGG64_09615 [Candidatus Latescibacteria bacterium]|jgi:hypothetical protein|nr:hypothetical protein [Candidatus Latescibacterota bacterium]